MCRQLKKIPTFRTNPSSSFTVSLSLHNDIKTRVAMTCDKCKNPRVTIKDVYNMFVNSEMTPANNFNADIP